MSRAAALTLVAASLIVSRGPAIAAAGGTTRISVDSAGLEGNGTGGQAALSRDGRYVAFASAASNLVPGDTNCCLDVFVRDRTTGTISRVSVDSAGNQANGGGSHPSISDDGRFVAFESQADNLVPGDTNGQTGSS